MKFKITQTVVAMLLIAICINTCRNAGQYLIKKDNVTYADAMVVLMGSVADRSLQAAQLYKKGIVDRVIIVEASLGGYQKLVDKGIKIVSNTEKMRSSLVSLGIPFESIIILPGKASSTKLEACIASEYIRKSPGIDTIIVVSSNFHTRRASMIFKSELNGEGHPVCVFVYPSAYTNFDSLKW